MQIIEVVQQVLETGVMPMAVERKIQALLGTRQFDEGEVRAIDQLIDALMHGRVRPVA